MGSDAEAGASQRRARSLDSLLRRLFNVTSSLVGLIVISPVLAVVAVAVKADSAGPVFYRQRRVGRGGVPFDILKFRSMRVDAEAVGGQLTVGADPRVTNVGRVIRAWKLDELPQLINVVKGDMDLVGPRPEVPRYVALYDEEQRGVLSVRPGITDPASVEFRSESDLMAGHPDPERLYVDEIMPRKLAINLEYLRTRSLASDIGVIFSTIAALARPRG
jgi:lipopolysaccharide/colanic/teichoic acid biosynthesis glycosyltransferase